MKYYLHDTSAIDDEKVTELYMKFGYEGVGLFYVILEKLGKQEKPMKTEVLKAQLKVGKRLEKCWLFMEEIGIISSNNGETFNKQLLNFSEKYQIKKEKTREKVTQWRKKQDDAESVTSYKEVSNLRKVKESKVNGNKVNKEIYIPPTFDEFKTYAIENNPSVNLKALELKYKAWKENNWRDGYNKRIVNWKSKLLNTIPYLNNMKEVKEDVFAQFKIK